jgi:hypothetical protein
MMLGTMGFIFASFGFLIFSSYRRARRGAEAGEPFQPAGKRRWDSEQS